jgi:hypothetical protein
MFQQQVMPQVLRLPVSFSSPILPSKPEPLWLRMKISFIYYLGT